MQLEALFLEQRRPLLRRLQRMVGPDAAADLCQETFARAWRGAPRDVPLDRQRGWLHRTAHNLAVDELRRRRLRAHEALDEAAWLGPEADPGERVAAREAVAALRPHDRLVLLLRFEAGLSHAEIGALLDVSEEAARKRVARARAAFATTFREASGPAPGPRVLLLRGGHDPGPYVAWLERAGARVRPLQPDRFRLQLATADALVLAGAIDDLHPGLYGQPVVRAEGCLDLARDRRDLLAVQDAVLHDVPIVGVCRGHQLLNVALGGTLHQEVERAAEHRGEAHAIATACGSRVRGLVGGSATVASGHHQAVHRLGRGLRATARSRDGVVEAVELERPRGRPVLGLQWHPESPLSGRAGERVATMVVEATTPPVR
jgi:putative glutamine amidotransferase